MPGWRGGIAAVQDASVRRHPDRPAASGYAAAMLTLYDHALAILLVVLFPVWGSTLGYRRLRRADPSDRPRLRVIQYRRAIGVQWVLAALLAALWLTHHRAPVELGLWPRLTFGLGGVLLGTLIVVGYMIRERGKMLADEEALAEVRRRLEHVEPMMPRTPHELRLFFALSITAGICEELLYRGYLIGYFSHGLGLIPSAVLATVAFGVGHSYQGVRGVLTTTAAGAFLAAVYLLTGSLFMSMVLHALMDVHSGHLGYVAFTARDAADARAALDREAELERKAREEAEAGRFEPDRSEERATDAGARPDEGDDAASV
jgi:membrane protease YdiL (CAAX protease family)